MKLIKGTTKNINFVKDLESHDELIFLVMYKTYLKNLSQRNYLILWLLLHHTISVRNMNPPKHWMNTLKIKRKLLKRLISMLKIQEAYVGRLETILIKGWISISIRYWFL